MRKFILITGNDFLSIKHRMNIILIDLLRSLNVNNYIFYEIDCEINDIYKLREMILYLKTPILFFKSIKLNIIICKNFCNLSKQNNEKQFKCENIEKDIVEALEIINNDKLECWPNSLIIFSGHNIDATSGLYNFFNNHGKIIELYSIEKKINEKSEVINKIRQYCILKKKNISNAAAEFLFKNLDKNLLRIYNEVDKIILYINKQNFIELDDCRLLVPLFDKLWPSVWLFIDSLSIKNISFSIKNFNKILAIPNDSSKNIEIFIFFQIINRIVEILKMKSFCENSKLNIKCNYNIFIKKFKNSEKNEINNLILNMHPYKAFKLFEYSFYFKNLELFQILDYIDDIKKKFILWKGDKSILIIDLILKICQSCFKQGNCV